MSILEKLKQKITESPVKKQTKELTDLASSNFLLRILKSTKLKPEVAKLGVELLKKRNHYDNTIELGSKEEHKFTKLIDSQVWENTDYYALLIYFFGIEKAKVVKKIWDDMPNRMYQKGYNRRSFRSPKNKRYVFLNQLNFLRSILEHPSIYDYPSGKYYYFNLTREEQVRFDNDITNSENIFLVWSEYLNQGDKNFYQLFEDIIFNVDQQGKVSRNIIKALLNSDKEENWLLVEKLLLSAQRQEGLRQTILEALDETSIGALKYMIHVILENKLTRFTSVVRAIDTWTGLGWTAEKESTVKSVLEYAKQYLNNPETISVGIKSKNNSEVYMALWSQGVYDVNKTVPHLFEMITNGTIEKKCLALLFTNEINDPDIEMSLYSKAISDENLQVISFALPHFRSLLEANVSSKAFINDPKYYDLFDRLYSLTQLNLPKTKDFSAKVFAWNTNKFDKNDLFRCMLYLVGDDDKKLTVLLYHFEEFSIDLRETIARNIFKDFYLYSYSNNDKSKENQKPSNFQKSFALRVLKDRGESILSSAFNVLSKVDLKADELISFQELFKRKGSTLRKNLISLLVKQEDKSIKIFVSNLVEEGDAEQRSAALELILHFTSKKRLQTECQKWISTIKQNSKLSEKEQKLIDQFEPKVETDLLTSKNGYSLFNPSNKTPFKLPKIDPLSNYSLLTSNDKYGLSISKSQLQNELNKLQKIFSENSNYEYEVENYDNSKEKVLLGNVFRNIKQNTDQLSNEEKFHNMPLSEIWDQWYKESKLTPSDLYIITLVEDCDNKTIKRILEDSIFYHQEIIPNTGRKYYWWNNPILMILKSLKLKYEFESKNDFLIGATIKLYSKLPTKILQLEQKQDRGYYYSRRDGNGWQQLEYFKVYLDQIELEKLTKDQIHELWNIYRWRQFSGLTENIALSKPPLVYYCLAYKYNFITKDELYEGIVDPDRIRELTYQNKFKSKKNDFKLDFDFLPEVIAHIQNTFLDVELKRGDLGTTVTRFVQNFYHIYGSNRFVEILVGLGKGNLHKGYHYYWNDSEVNKQQLFSSLLKRCYPEATDTQENFNELISKNKISELRLIQAAIYAPQWQKFISSYLKWEGLDSAIWWMHAHTKSSDYVEQNSELESEVAKYSTIDLRDFKDGAVDKIWFESAYKKLGKAKWELLYDSAKYITDGNGHRRARLYADTILGDLKIREVTTKVKDKRDQDYLRVYGLVPLSKTNPQKDVLGRYEYLQQFKKESKEFGSMRQTSEALAIRIALENLARNAGYPDPMRLIWAMEKEQVQAILSNKTAVEIEGLKIYLSIDKDGKADILVNKDGKEIKSIPVKHKKNPVVLELQKSRKKLREQFNRSRKGLEEAMVNGDLFDVEEIRNLSNHPIISKHIEKLVLISSSNKIGFFHENHLKSVQNILLEIDPSEKFRFAHSFDLHKNGVWSDYQSYCFENKLKQPFKQIFRELYVPTPDELAEKSISRRYAGHQVNPKQALALFKTRAWKVDYEEGLQKVFHKEGFQVKLYAYANWFSPSDIESPTLETIEFHSLKNFKNIPFEEIEPRIFSEVMRDLDLVVSVAHVGAVDPEMSQSSIEMRSVLIKETLRLFKLTNVEVEGSHARINGKMANYSVHLGSGIVHQTPGKYLSVLPVHSQHRGRIFLPFADDDPKTAELISKVLLFAKDNEIQDPTILSQIDR